VNLYTRPPTGAKNGMTLPDFSPKKPPINMSTERETERELQVIGEQIYALSDAISDICSAIGDRLPDLSKELDDINEDLQATLLKIENKG
jgi:hypothetical protein